MRPATCVIGVGDPSDVIPCGDSAPYMIERWGRNPRNRDMPACEHHAYKALQDDADVTGPHGHECRIDEVDGEIYERAS